ncbi:MAG: AAA family ATPase [Oscillospiraceae bacterium]
MYLKALEIQGFKSFADKTRLTFEKDITAIVGPNGSGKSNISDAILWVMGEQRSKALRGSKMEDVIFGGTEKRGALGYAQVSLIIDNSAHIFDSDSSEIMLTRRYYRSGESEYFINRESVRLKDINSLLMDTGLGRDGYSIIGQGRIAEIVSSKSTDRREVFEEAAGISRFRYRKEEAERKLEKTEENLLRINDKIEELEMQVEPLRKQAETAKRYLVLRDELRIQEISVWMSTLEKLRDQAKDVELEFKQTSQNLEQARERLKGLYASTQGFTERMQQKDVETEEARSRLSQAEAENSRLEAEAAVLKANMESSAKNRQSLLEDIEKQEGRVQEIQENIDKSRERIGEINSQLEGLKQDLTGNENVLTGCRMKLSRREASVKELGDEATQLQVDGRSMDSRINMLSEMEKDYEGYSKAVKTVMRESRRGNLRGIHAPVANLIKADEECALAIETALGAAAQNIVVDTQEDGRRAIELLKRSDSGRATFLPMDAIRGSVMKDTPERDPGFVGIASQLVKYDSRYEQIVSNLLGRTVVAEALSDAVRMSRNSGNRLRIVTLDGQMINAGGSMTGGSSARGSGILSRANELERLKKDREKLREREELSAKQLEKAQRELAAVRYELDMALEEQGQLRSRYSSLEAELKATENSANQLRLLLTACRETARCAAAQWRPPSAR